MKDNIFTNMYIANGIRLEEKDSPGLRDRLREDAKNLEQNLRQIAARISVSYEDLRDWYILYYR